jgi:copper chaperone CopZ
MKALDHTPAVEVAAVVNQRFAVIGMTCGHCEHAVATEVGRLGGVTAAVADAAAGTVTIEANRELDVAEVSAAVEEAGYELAR